MGWEAGRPGGEKAKKLIKRDTDSHRCTQIKKI